MLDLYLLGLLWIALLLATYYPRRFREAKYQTQVESKEVDFSTIPALDMAFFSRIGEFAGNNGFRKFKDIHTNIDKVDSYSRTFLAPDGSILLSAIQWQWENGATLPRIQYITRYDNACIMTSCSRTFDIFAYPPDLVASHYPKIDDPGILLDLHRQASERHGRGAAVDFSGADSSAMDHDIDRKIMEWNVARGILRRSHDGKWYLGTYKLGFRVLAEYIAVAISELKERRVLAAIMASIAATSAGWWVYFQFMWLFINGYIPFDSIHALKTATTFPLGLLYALAGILIGFKFGGWGLFFSLIALFPAFTVVSALELIPPKDGEMLIYLSGILLRSSYIAGVNFPSLDNKARVLRYALEILFYVALFSWAQGWNNVAGDF